VINVGARQGIKSWGRIDYETLLQWDPEIIIVPQGSHLRAQLTASAMLKHARAIKTNRVFEIPAVYLNAGSQYMILSANLLAGIVYERFF
jgi:iron complex transport system substrate-binding protein